MAESLAKRVEEQMEQIRRGAADIVPEEELRERLAEAIRQESPLRVKLGLDPTAPDIHLGNAIPLQKLRVFQQLGHHAILIVGDYTATVGDPSGQSVTRPQLSHDEVMEHAKTYLNQVGKIVDMDEAEVVMNGEWFSKMTFSEVLQLAGKITVARCIERDDFRSRMESGQPVGLHELLYPLMQAYDSVVVRSDVELGGTDQVFNIMLGRELQRQVGQRPQVAVTNPLLEGLDGTEKMSKSKGNYIGICDPPAEMFGKAMSIPDALMQKYLILTTDLPIERIDELMTRTHPREAKATLAGAIVKRYYDEETAQKARQEFDRVFKERRLPQEMPELSLASLGAEEGPISLVELLRLSGATETNSGARRLIEQGGVSLGPDADSLEVIRDVHAEVQIPEGTILKVGKRRYFRCSVK